MISKKEAEAIARYYVPQSFHESLLMTWTDTEWCFSVSLRDVSDWLGYGSTLKYNTACYECPEEVIGRIKDRCEEMGIDMTPAKE